MSLDSNHATADRELNAIAYPELELSQLKVLQAIANIACGSVASHPISLKGLTKRSEVSESSVRRALTVLKHQGYIEVSIKGRQQWVRLLKRPFFVVEGHDELAKNLDIQANIAGCVVRESNHTVTKYRDRGFRLGYPYYSLADIRLSYGKDFTPQLKDLFNECCEFDLSRLVKAAGLDGLRPFGVEHSWKFDFTELNELLYPTAQRAAFVMDMFPAGDAFSMNRPLVVSLWREFFIFSMVLELAVFPKDLFNAYHLKKCDGKDVDMFKKLAVHMMQGPLFYALLSNREESVEGLMKRVLKNFSPAGDKADIYQYTVAAVRNEVVGLLSSRPSAIDMGRTFIKHFQDCYAGIQTPFLNAISMPMNSEQLVRGAWGPDLYRGGLLTPATRRRLLPRFHAPLLMFRQLAMITLATDTHWELNPDKQNKALALNYRCFTDPDNRMHLDRLRELLRADFPFMMNFGKSTSMEGL